MAGVDFCDAVDHVVHEGAVVRHYDDGAVIAAQKALEPLHALEVEVVGGLVEKQKVGLAYEQLGKGDAHLPSAGEFARGARHVLFFESKAEHDASHLGLQDVAAKSLVGVAGAPARLQLLRCRIASEPLFEHLEPALSLEHLQLA